MPTVLCSALATVTPFVVTSCKNDDNDTKVSGYTIDRNTDCIYGLNDSGEKFLLNQEQFKELEGCFLIGLESGGFIFVDKDGNGSDGQTYPKTIAGFISQAMANHYLRMELFLINGEYKLGDVDAPTSEGSYPIVSLNGIVGYDGKLMSTLDCNPGTGTGANLQNLAQLNLRSLEIEGTQSAKEKSTTQWAISGIGQLDVSYSCLHGSISFDADVAYFDYCWFDSSKVELNDNNKTDYALCLTDTLYAYFTDCCFWSRGKAIKVYLPLKDLGEGTTVDTWYQIVNCSFWIVGEIPINTDKARTEADQNKFCFDIYNVPGGHFDSTHKLTFRYSGVYGDYDPSNAGVHPDASDTSAATIKYHHLHGGVFGSKDTGQFNDEFLDAAPLI